MFLQIFELIARIIKTILLSTVYTTLVFLLLFFISTKVKSKWLEKRKKHKFRNWLLIHFLISILLFSYSFSYWQNTGLGDNPQLPIGYGQIIYSPDFSWTSFYPDLEKTKANKDELEIGSFKIKGNMLCAEVSHQFSNSPKYDFIVYNLLRSSYETFNSEQAYNEFAQKNGLPLKHEFYDFRHHFDEYLNSKPKWQKWMLP
jgi:heme/copper-type cytochrome/quinol oxidase subunit 2